MSLPVVCRFKVVIPVSCGGLSHIGYAKTFTEAHALIGKLHPEMKPYAEVHGINEVTTVKWVKLKDDGEPV